MAEGMVCVKGTDIVIRALEHVQEMSIAVDLQRAIWGYGETDTVPDQIFLVAKECGGQVLGAFHQTRPVGFALAFPAVSGDAMYLHSHMVGVLPEYRNGGVGRLLKLAQREDAIARGFNLIKWTFDPLQLKNAYFNIMRLGAIVRRYIPNFYGRTSSPLHAGLPTDRLVAEWWIQSPRVRNALNGERTAINILCSRISIPASIRQICETDAAEAEKIQKRVREQFQQHTANGEAAVGFEFDEKQASYLLENYED
jgi:predicted GNAT superfamily acetyltransferase